MTFRPDWTIRAVLAVSLVVCFWWYVLGGISLVIVKGGASLSVLLTTHPQTRTISSLRHATLCLELVTRLYLLCRSATHPCRLVV